jgi:hypothetical protein
VQYPAECGYFNLADTIHNHYYQVYFDDMKEVIAKGFSYRLDTFYLKPSQIKNRDDSFLDSLIILPMDRNRLNNELNYFGFQIDERIQETVRISQLDRDFMVDLEIEALTSLDNKMLIRAIEFFNQKSNQ